MKTIVFAGPSIAGRKLRCLSTVVQAPPIKRGDLAAVDEYDVIVILDGEFGQHHAVSPKEILTVLGQGKTVIGAASMGALRASELDRSGMIGVGWVYEYLRRQAVRRDADVALAYSIFDFKPMTVPVVDVEYWMEGALAAGLIDRTDQTLVLKIARKFFFAERTADRLTDALRRTMGDQLLQSLLSFSGGAIPSIKSLDADAAVRRAASLTMRGTRDARVE
jgi:hypothetical protein